MPTVYSKNYSRRQVDCAEYEGDLIFEECNLAQETPDTGQGAIFINTGNLTALTCLNSNCVNHRQPPQGGVVYEGCNVSGFDFFIPRAIGVQFDQMFYEQKAFVWKQLTAWVVANPTATLVDFKAWFIANQGHTIFFADTFIDKVREMINDEVGGIVSWSTFKTYLLNHYTDTNWDGVL